MQLHRVGLIMLVPNVALQYEVGVNLVQRELLSSPGAVERNYSTGIPSKSRLQPNLQATSWHVRNRRGKYSRAQYRAVMTETETVVIFQPMYLVLRRMKRAESRDQNAE